MLVVSCHMGIAKTALLIGAGFLAGLLVGRQSHTLKFTEERKAPTASSEQRDAPRAAMDAGHASMKTSTDTSKTNEGGPITFPELAREVDRLSKFEAGSEEVTSGWDNLGKRVNRSNLKALAEALVEDYPSPASEALMSMVLGDFAQQNPKEAWQMLHSARHPYLRNFIGTLVIQTLAEKDIDGALALVNQLPESVFKTQMHQAALTGLAVRNPEKAFALEVERAGAHLDFDPSFLLWDWARVDPEAAMAAVSALKGNAAMIAASTLISSIASREPERAWEFAQRLPRTTGDHYTDPRYSALSAWGQSDPKAAMEKALQVEDVQLRNSAVEAIARQWADHDFSAALSFVSQLSDPGSRAKGLVGMSGANQPNHAELFAAIRQHGPVGENYSVTNLLQAWARKDPQAAASALKQMPPGPAQEEAVPELVRGWMSTDNVNAQSVIKWIESLNSVRAKSYASRIAFETLAQRDPSAASQLLGSVPTLLKSSAVDGLAMGWSSSNPEQAAAWAATLPQTERESALSSIVGAWARQSPQRAAEFAQKHDSNGALVSSVASEWLPYAPEQAGTWVDKLPKGEVRDIGLVRVAEIVGREDPGAAILWAQRISSTPKRNDQLEQICRQWLEADPVAAKQWISSSSFSAETKLRYLTW
jgi:hypothetical protein